MLARRNLLKERGWERRRLLGDCRRRGEEGAWLVMGEVEEMDLVGYLTDELEQQL